MTLDYAIFANSAILSDDGLFSLLGGGIEWVGAETLPATCRNLVLLAHFTFDATECGNEYECVVQVTDPDGDTLTPNLAASLRPPKNKFHPDQPNTFVAQYGYDRFTFQKVGVHRFRFLIDDRLLGEAKLEATKGPRP